VKTSAERAVEIVRGHLGAVAATSTLSFSTRHELAVGIVRALLAGLVALQYIGLRRTLKQNAFIHVFTDWVAHRMAMDPEVVKEGIKDKYGARWDNPFLPGQGSAKPTHLYSTQEIDLYINGLVAEAADATPPVDCTAFLLEYERIKAREQKRTAKRRNI
jgi:hypothetical protein